MLRITKNRLTPHRPGRTFPPFGPERIITKAPLFTPSSSPGTTSAPGAISILGIGLANIAGTLTARWLGKHYSRKNLLALIYFLRTVMSALFIMLPITPATVLLFSLGMGPLWLATIPLTSGLVAHIYGLRYMGTL